MAKYRNDRDALRHRADQLEDDLEDAEALIEAQRAEIDALKRGEKPPNKKRKKRRKKKPAPQGALDAQSDPATIVKAGKIVGNKARYVLRNEGYFGAVACVTFVLTGLGMAISAMDPIPFYIFAPVGILFTYQKGIDVDLGDGAVTMWKRVIVRFGQHRPRPISIRVTAESAAEIECASITLGDDVVATRLRLARAREIAYELGNLFGVEPEFL